MAEHGHNELNADGYMPFCSLAGAQNACVGEAIGFKPALLPEMVVPQGNANLPKLGG